jgi:starvation-inducible DNA-binding protein
MNTNAASNVSSFKSAEPKVPKFFKHEKDSEQNLQIVGYLNQSLAHAIDLRSRTKQAYWSAKGDNLYTLQKMLNDFSLELDRATDQLAARVMAMQGIPVRTIAIVAATSKLPNYPTGLVQASDHLTALIASYEATAEHLPAAMRLVVQINDYPTATILTNFAKLLDEHVSLFSAHIPAEWVAASSKKSAS